MLNRFPFGPSRLLAGLALLPTGALPCQAALPGIVLFEVKGTPAPSRHPFFHVPLPAADGPIAGSLVLVLKGQGERESIDLLVGSSEVMQPGSLWTRAGTRVMSFGPASPAAAELDAALAYTRANAANGAFVGTLLSVLGNPAGDRTYLNLTHHLDQAATIRLLEGVKTTGQLVSFTCGEGHGSGWSFLEL